MSANTRDNCVWILGLIHSGTTIFWRAWRRDARFLCFDEPFGALLHLPRDNAKKTRSELVELFEQELDPRLFWQRHAPLHPLEELNSAFTPQQQRWLEHLVSRASRTVVDETRLHLHLPALAELTERAHVIHLYRRARSFVTSHLRPSWSKDTTWWRRAVRRLRHAHNESVFWSRDDYPPGMERDTVIGAHPKSKFGLMLSDAGYDADRIMESSAVVRLLAYWHYHYHRLEQEGPRLFGDRFTTVRYEEFARQPASVMRGLYDWLELAPPGHLQYPEVHEPRLPFRPRDRRWREAARVAGFSDAELVTHL